MSPLAWTVYLAGLAACGVLALAALVLGVPLYAGLAVVCAAAFGFSGPYVLGGRWRQRPPPRRPRPVRRRR